GETALKVSTIVKFSQNVMLGIAAFAISIYWTYTGKGEKMSNVEKPSLRVIWERFPKFVLGFVLASLVFSFLLSPATISAVSGSLKTFRTLWFALPFPSIGLETRFAALSPNTSPNPFYAFFMAQPFNVVVTLVVAWFLFG